MLYLTSKRTEYFGQTIAKFTAPLELEIVFEIKIFKTKSHNEQNVFLLPYLVASKLKDTTR